MAHVAELTSSATLERKRGISLVSSCCYMASPETDASGSIYLPYSVLTT